MSAAVEIVERLLAADKRRWVVTHEGLQFEIERSAPTYHTGVGRRDDVEVVIDTWTVAVIVERENYIERRPIHHDGGMVYTMRETSEPGGSASHAAAVHAMRCLEKCREAIKIYAEGYQRLSVMVDAELARKYSHKLNAKARKIQRDAVYALRYHDLVQDRRTLGLVVGETVLIVTRSYNADEWTELTYRVGDRAVWGSYNLAYIGTITSISPKTITVVDLGKTKRMNHGKFISYNDSPIARADARNAAWTD